GDKLRLFLTELVPEFREEKRRKTEVVDGKQVQVEYTVRVLAYRPVSRVSELTSPRVFGTDGKPIDPKRLPDLLKKKTVVLVFGDSTPIAPFSLRTVREGRLIVVPSVPLGPPEPKRPPPKDGK